MMKLKKASDVVFTLLILIVISINGIFIYMATKTTQFTSVYHLYWFSLLIFSVILFKEAVFDKHNIKLIIIGIILGGILSLISITLSLSHFPRWRMLYMNTFDRYGLFYFILDQMTLFWSWLITPLIFLWVKFVFIREPSKDNLK
ncbi:hypothetical protein [Hafnia sp. CBA7124]|uniref:hypothetical protein n=1 Tax=Hafnia sp. CBA7124 TaxID=1848580 RepID=UPI000BBA4E10|nr:hypothetical protein [Hafnia sp. CBA7124]